MRRLTKEYQELVDNFKSSFEDGGCSCHINPPCNYCTDPGNPEHLDNVEDAWEHWTTTSKALTWDDLANLYPGTARIKPMEQVFAWAEKQRDKFFVCHDTGELYHKQNVAATTFKTVAVKYATSTQLYTFMTDEECKVGDKAVVFTNGNWSVVTIMEVHDKPQLTGNYKYTWLVQIVDRTNYDRHIQEDHEGTPQVGSRL